MTLTERRRAWPERHSVNWGCIATAAIALSASCAQPQVPSMATASGTLVVVASAGLASAGSSEILDATRFRRAFGLREDEAWVLAVAADPRSIEGTLAFGVPLLPFEVADLESRPRIGSEIVVLMQRYGAAVPDSWGGVFFDQQHDGIVTGNFVRDLDRHRTTLANLMPGAQFEVHLVDRSRATLSAMVKDVERERAWFDSMDVQLLSAEIDDVANQVRLLYLGRLDAVTAVREHFGNADWLRVERAGPGPWLGPLGNLTILVVDDDGRPVEGMGCSIYPEDPEARVGEIGYGTGVDGQCVIRDVPVSRYLVEVGRERPSEEYSVVASGHVTVRPGATSTLEVSIPNSAKP